MSFRAISGWFGEVVEALAAPSLYLFGSAFNTNAATNLVDSQ